MWEIFEFQILGYLEYNLHGVVPEIATAGFVSFMSIEDAN